MANAILRERFLNFFKWLPDNQVGIEMFDGPKVNGTISAVDAIKFKSF